jgi:lipopolysaccharide export system permease protein
MKVYRARLAGYYILSEMLPSFILGNVVFLFILLMFQVLRLSDFVINKGVPISLLFQMVMYILVSFLPACIPISLLFSILLTLGRMSSDSEIVAFKSSGLNLNHILIPTLAFATSVAIISAYVSFYAAPWGNRAFEVLITRLGNTKAAANLQEGTFAEGYFDLVLYAGKVNSKQGSLKDVFIYDERDSENPITIIASEGKLVEADPHFPGKGVTLRLINGNIHKNNLNNYAKIDFKTYDISLANAAADSIREKSPQSFTFDDLSSGIHDASLKDEDRRIMRVEMHKRWAISAACIVFGLLGVGTGTVTNRRAVRASGLVVSLLIMVSYWILYITGDSLARNGTLPPWMAMWFANVLFTFFGIYTFRKAW